MAVCIYHDAASITVCPSCEFDVCQSCIDGGVAGVCVNCVETHAGQSADEYADRRALHENWETEHLQREGLDMNGPPSRKELERRRRWDEQHERACMVTNSYYEKRQEFQARLDSIGQVPPSSDARLRALEAKVMEQSREIKRLKSRTQTNRSKSTTRNGSWWKRFFGLD